MTKTWDVRLSTTTVVGIGRGASPEPEAALRVEYRPIGNRGRFHVFTIIGPIPKGRTVADVITAYNAERGPVAWR